MGIDANIELALRICPETITGSFSKGMAGSFPLSVRTSETFSVTKWYTSLGLYWIMQRPTEQLDEWKDQLVSRLDLAARKTNFDSLKCGYGNWYTSPPSSNGLPT
jgi:hypothetical protein